MRAWFVLLLLCACRPGNIWVIEGPAEGPDAGVTNETPKSPLLDAGTTARDATTPPPPDDAGTTTPPPSLEVTLIRPLQGAVLEGEVEVEATAMPGADRVELFADGNLIAALESPPYVAPWTGSAGVHALHAEAVLGAERARSAVVTVAVDGGFVETFANGAEDQPGWTHGAGFAVGTAEDHTGDAGSGALAGELTTTALETIESASELAVTLGAEPTMKLFTKLDLGGAGFVYGATFRVLVDQTVVHEVSAANAPVTEDWTQVELDLANQAERDVTIRFELSVTNWSWNQEAHARAWIDDLEIRSSGAPPPPPPPPPPPTGGGYDHASEQASDLVEVLSLTGHYGLSVTGGHLIAGDASGGSSLPRETPVSSSGQISIPAGATVRHALLWYAGVIFMKPHTHGEGDYTPDLGGALDGASDVAQNGITFAIDGQTQGPFDAASRTPPGASSLGSDSTISPRMYDPKFGTLTGVKESVWGNRLDVTGLFSGRTGTIDIAVQPPERLDVNGNDATSNGGNPAGNTNYNLCASGASWSLLVIYEKPDLPEKNLVLMGGPWARAWDYMFFHKGEWIRPKVRIDHAPIADGARFIVYAGSGAPSGGSIPQSPACSCGCGGQYTLKNNSSPLGRNGYFSDQHEDPPAAQSDPMHRDRTNGPWYLHSTGAQGKAGNDWTLFQSGARFTEFPNLFEGEQTPAADGTQPVTHEDDPDPQNDVYGGHPWAGRGTVSYLAHGNAMSVVEVVPQAVQLTPGETTSYLYFKGDQKDVWKPQAVVSVKYILFETPTGN